MTIIEKKQAQIKQLMKTVEQTESVKNDIIKNIDENVKTLENLLTDSGKSEKAILKDCIYRLKLGKKYILGGGENA